jgi:ParB family chromosome partitioning protein
MARKRLSPPQDTYLAPLETKGLSSPFAARPPAPIAQIAGDSAVVAALREVTDELQAARAEGRLVQRLPLATIEADHLVRDRIVENDDEMRALLISIRARGQQSPIEVVELEQGRFGLISGRRRLRAVTALYEETGDPRFATIQALLRRPNDASDSYLAMVEENEIRVGLSHYERARIAARAVEMGVYTDLPTALRHLFQTASRAKRSKIGSFVTVYRNLDGALRFPVALPERLGLMLAHALDADPHLAPQIASALTAAVPKTAVAEQALVKRFLASPKPNTSDPEPFAPGIWVKTILTAQGTRIILTGPGLDDCFADKLKAWLKQQS